MTFFIWQLEGEKMTCRVTKGYLVEARGTKGWSDFVIYQFEEILINNEVDEDFMRKLLFSVRGKKELLAGSLAVNTVTYYGGGMDGWTPNMHAYFENIGALRREMIKQAKNIGYDEKEGSTDESVERILRILIVKQAKLDPDRFIGLM